MTMELLIIILEPFMCHFNPFTAKGPEMGLFQQSNHIRFFIQRALSKADSMQFNLLVVSLYKNVVFYEKKKHISAEYCRSLYCIHSLTTRSSILSVMPLYLQSVSFIEVFSLLNDTWLDAELNYLQSCNISS